MCLDYCYVGCKLATHFPHHYDRYWDQGDDFMALVNLCTKLLLGCGYYTLYGIQCHVY